MLFQPDIQDWVAANEERSKGWKTTPYFIRDNFVDGSLSERLKHDVQKEVIISSKDGNVSIYNVNFAGDSEKDMNINYTVEYIYEARLKFDSYGSEWKKAYFDEKSGGFNVYHKEHKFSPTGGGGEAEKKVGEILAKYNGKQVEFLPEGKEKSPDVKFDIHTWDIKYIETANENTIRKYILDARKADNVIFYWEINEKLFELNNASKREIGRLEKGQISGLPEIYYIDKKNLLRLLCKKKRLNK